MERGLRDLGTRVESIEGKGASSEAEIARVSAELETERRSLRAELETLAALVAGRGGRAQGIERALGELGARLLIVEERGTLSSSEIARVSAALDAERQALRAQLDALAASVADPGSSSAVGRGLGVRCWTISRQGCERSRRVAPRPRPRSHGPPRSGRRSSKRSRRGSRTRHGLPTERQSPRTPRPSASSPSSRGASTSSRRDRQAMVAELARCTPGRPSAPRSSLGSTRRPPGRRGRVRGANGAPAAVGDEVVQLRVAVEGLRMRLASSEQELATLVGERESGTRVEEVARRLDALERAPVVIAGAADGGPIHGDGRFRVEMRALELRTEVAEATARENREAVLVQLERLAARSTGGSSASRRSSRHTPPKRQWGGQVVPIRPEDCRGVAIRESGYTTPMRLLDLLFLLGARGSWARSRLAYLVLQSVIVGDRARR